MVLVEGEGAFTCESTGCLEAFELGRGSNWFFDIVWLESTERRMLLYPTLM